MTILTSNYKWELMNLFINGPSEDDGEGHGFVNVTSDENALFSRDGFRIIENVSNYDRDLEFRNPILALAFDEAIPTELDGQYHGESEEAEGFYKNDFIQVVRAHFISHEAYQFEYNNQIYRVARLDRPAVEYDLKELVENWIFKILKANKERTFDNLDWVILLDTDAETPGWEQESLYDFGRDARGLGFILTFRVKFQITQNPSG